MNKQYLKLVASMAITGLTFMAGNFIGGMCRTYGSLVMKDIYRESHRKEVLKEKNASTKEDG